MSAVTSFAEAVQFAARCVECPICKEACENPVRPKNCSHRYCMGCFRKCFQDKQEKHCATCRTPILSDALFSKVAALVPGIREAESDDDFDLAKMMERHRLQSAKIRQEAVQMRQGQPAKQPVVHATRQHPEPTAPTSGPPATQHTATNGGAAAAASAPMAAAPGPLPPLDAGRPRSPLPPLSPGGPIAAGGGAGAGYASAAAAPQPPAGAPPPHGPAADAGGSQANPHKRSAEDMAAPAAGAPPDASAGPGAKRAKG